MGQAALGLRRLKSRTSAPDLRPGCHLLKMGSSQACGAHQVGDQLDRGDNEIEILYFLERLQQEARAAGGALHVLTGNHETMNAQGRFRYSTPEGTSHFQRWQLIDAMAAALKVRPPQQACHQVPEAAKAILLGQSMSVAVWATSGEAFSPVSPCREAGWPPASMAMSPFPLWLSQTDCNAAYRRAGLSSARGSTGISLCPHRPLLEI